MTVPYPDFSKDVLTYGEVYSYACEEIFLPIEAQDFTNRAIRHMLDHNPNLTVDKATEIFKSNLGYIAGYYDFATRERANELFGAIHPIFGLTRPTPEEALQAGLDIGRKINKDE